MAAELKPLPLRCKTKNGQQMIENINSDTSVADFKAIMSSLSGIQQNRLKILSGFPPRPLDLTNDLKTMHALGLRPRDTVIIEELLTTSVPITSNQETKPPKTGIELIPSADLMEAGSEVSQGILLRQEVPSNNSCLFTSVHFCVNNGRLDESIGSSMRKIIADTVSSDPETFNEGILGRTPEDYCKWILDKNNWGGAIELAILSAKYSIEIVAVDTQNVRFNRFGEDKNYSKRIFVIYDGIHYDPLQMELFDGSGKVKTIFSTNDDYVLTQALELAREAKNSRQFTDVQNFTLKCMICKTRLTGQSQAQDHAKKTGHLEFGEV